MPAGQQPRGDSGNDGGRVMGKERPKATGNARYPYTHHGPAVHGSKMADYLVSELSLREDHPELFEDDPADVAGRAEGVG